MSGFLEAFVGPALVLALAAVFVSGALSGLAGFGSALVNIPLLLLVYEPGTVIAVNAALSLFVMANVALDSRRELRAGIVLWLAPFSVLGAVAGARILQAAEPEYIRLAVGPVVVLSAILLHLGTRLPGAKSRWGDAAAGSASGLLGTSTGIGGPPVILLLASRELPKRVFRGNIAAYFMCLSAISLAVLFLGGLAEAGDLALAALLVPATFAGKVAGTALLGRFSEESFRSVTLVLVVLTGIFGTVGAIWALL